MISSFTIVLSIVVRFTFLTKRIPLFPGQALTLDITSRGYPETAWSKGRVVGYFADLISGHARSLRLFSRKVAVDHIEGEVALAKRYGSGMAARIKLEELPVSSMVLLNPELLFDFG